jgi:hypothetical protein
MGVTETIHAMIMTLRRVEAAVSSEQTESS